MTRNVNKGRLHDCRVFSRETLLGASLRVFGGGGGVRGLGV